MEIQYCSDLHLEFPENKKFLKENPLKPMGDILLLAGDIVPFAVMDKHNDFFNYVSDNFEFTYWIPGNHEYYYFDVAKKHGTLNEKIKDNVFLVNNIAIQYEQVRFLFSTLWTKINPVHQLAIQQSISDFQVIRFNENPFTPFHFNDLHNKCFSFIESELHSNYTGKTVVITHHVPTFLNYPEKYKDDILNEAFAVELFDLIETKNIDYWIFGHHHQNIPDFEIGSTKLVTNQLGYVKYNENKGFKNNKCIF